MSLSYLHGIETIETPGGVRPIQAVRSSVMGIVGTAPDAVAGSWPLNEPIAVTGGASALADLGTTGTLPDALAAILAQGVSLSAVVVRVEEGVDLDATTANVIGAVGAKTGLYALNDARSEVGMEPRLLLAPGFTGHRPGNAANPVVAAFQAYASSRRAMILKDGPNTTQAEAITDRDDWGSDRIYITDPGVKVFKEGATVIEPASAFVAGTVARVDRDKGYHFSPSNHEIFGITGTARPIEFAMGDRNTEANILNENRIATIIRDGGFFLWGNETTATDPLNRFFSVRRTHDIIIDSVENAQRVYMDRPFSVQLLLDIAESVNSFLRVLRARGVTLGADVWLDPELNTAETWASGQLFVSYDAEAPAPLQHLIFYFNRNTGYYDELSREAAAEIARLAA